MAKTVAVTLDDHQERFVRAQVKGHHFSSADEVVSEGLRLLEQREAENDRIRQALIEGEKSGVVETTVSEIFAEVIAENREQCG